MTQFIGMDLGTANTLVCVCEKGSGATPYKLNIILNEPSVVAVDYRTGESIAVGSEARKMIGRTPDYLRAIRPLKDGVIADFDYASKMIGEFIRRVSKNRMFPVLGKPKLAIGVPSGITSVEKRAVREAAENAGAGQVYLIEEPMAAAIGACLPITEPLGSMIVDIGGGTTEIAVVSLSGIVEKESIRVAGDELNESIIQYLKKVYNLAIGERTAEEIKVSLGPNFGNNGDDKFEVRGLNLINGLPRTVSISQVEVREAMVEPLSSILEAVKRTLEKTPPELAADIFERGITLAGGGALLDSLDVAIRNEVEVPVYIAENPLECVVIGTGRVLVDKSLHRVLEHQTDQGTN
ncbi:MAG: rod shape-determining protein [Candidatus Caenarcaniphilales bacterium]|nr:rod shape-determining protein [Candidatus Caenarcaniphilales bacterium]